MNTPHTGSQGATPEGPETFAFSPDSMDRAREIIACYPEARRRSAVMPLLDLAQRQIGGWLPLAAMDHVAGLLDMPAIRVYEVASFYTMYNLAPVGRHHVQVCTTTPCWLRGSDAILGACRKTLGIDVGETTEDGEFTLGEVECLGACVNAPVVKIGDDYFEDLDPAAVKRVLEALKKGESVTPGVQGDRVSSEPVTGLTTLTDLEAKEPPAKSGPSQSSPSQSGES